MVFSRVGPNQSIEWGQIRISKSDGKGFDENTGGDRREIKPQTVLIVRCWWADTDVQYTPSFDLPKLCL